jgi:hypothetical protein
VYIPTRPARNILIKRYISVADVASFNNLYLQGAYSILEVSVVYPRYLVMLSRTHRDNTRICLAGGGVPTHIHCDCCQGGCHNACISFRGLQCSSYSTHALRLFPNGQLTLRTLSISFPNHSKITCFVLCQSVQRRATGWGSIPGNGKRFLSTPVYRTALGPTQAPIQQAPRILTQRSGREADHLPPSSAEIKNGRAIPPLLHTSSWHGA